MLCRSAQCSDKDRAIRSKQKDRLRADLDKLGHGTRPLPISDAKYRRRSELATIGGTPSAPAFFSAGNRARPRRLTSSATSFIDGLVNTSPSPLAREASASSIAARASSRRRSRSTHRASASRTAPSALRTRPSATARPIKPCCSAGSSIWKVCSRLAGPKARMCGNQEIRTGLSSATNSMPVLCADPSGRQFLHRTIKGRRYHRLHLGTG